jgi:acetyl esterase/lipase
MTPVRTPAPELDHELRPLAGAAPDLTLDDSTLPTLRGGLADMVPATEPSAGVTRTDHLVDAGTGVVVRVHQPAEASGPRACVYSMHGGGYVLGDRGMDDQRLDQWCLRFGCVGVSVEYRLAPEHPFPAAHEDCLAGLAWVFGHAAELGVDPARVIVGGASAGGGLAAAVALLARDRGAPALLGQLLVCPMLDDRNETPSSWQMAGQGIWDRAANDVGWTALLGEARGGPDVSPYAAPARATDLSGLPPAFVDVGSAETFRDEDVAYASRLWQAGGSAELHVWPGGFHGFTGAVPQAALSRAAVTAQRDWLGRLLNGID